MILRTSFAVAALVLGAQTVARAADLEPVGTWLVEDGRAKIRTEKCGDGNADVCGYVVWLKEPLTEKGVPKTDIKNPDPAKRNRPSLGLELIEGFKADDDGVFKGQIYNAENGKMYDASLSRESDTELKIKGCMLKFLCGSQTWTKVADLPVPTAKKTAAAAAAAHKQP